MTRTAASNYVLTLKDLRRFEEVKSLLRKTIPVARRVLGEGHDITLRMRKVYARALYGDPAATLSMVAGAALDVAGRARCGGRGKPSTSHHVPGSSTMATASIWASQRKSEGFAVRVNSLAMEPRRCSGWQYVPKSSGPLPSIGMAKACGDRVSTQGGIADVSVAPVCVV